MVSSSFIKSLNLGEDDENLKSLKRELSRLPAHPLTKIRFTRIVTEAIVQKNNIQPVL